MDISTIKIHKTYLWTNLAISELGHHLVNVGRKENNPEKHDKKWRWTFKHD